MFFEEFLSEIKSNLQSHVSSGLIDDSQIYSLMLDGLSELSIMPTIRIETILDVKNNKVKLPDGFRSLYSAVKCEPFGVISEDDDKKDVLLDTYLYKVRETNTLSWNTCNPCDVTETDSCIVEKVYLHDGSKHNIYYNNVQSLKLKLTPHVRRNKCDKECVNFKVVNSPNEISINNKYLYTNFKEGSIFMVYNGYDEDDDGFVIIPETPGNNVYKFLKAYVIKELIKILMINGDLTGVEQNLLSLYTQESMLYLQKASGELRMARIFPNMKNYSKKIRKEFQVFDYGHNTFKGGDKVGFIVV